MGKIGRYTRLVACFILKVVCEFFYNLTNRPLPVYQVPYSRTVFFQTYDYTLPMAIFAMFGVLALIVALMLKVENKKKGYGLEEANIQK